jgi:hypothetical protein
MKKAIHKVLLRTFLAGITAELAMVVGGCGDFFRTDFIKEKASEIISREDDLIKKYKEESGIELQTHPQRKLESFFTIDENNTYTLYYQVEFVDIASLEKLLKEQYKDATISSLPGINQLVVNIKNKAQLSSLEELLGNSDRLPPQVLLRFSASSDFGDKAQDYASQLNMRLETTGGDLGAITSDSILPGASERLRARANMGTTWGTEIDTSAFTMKAALDVLESYGYVQHLYQTNILLSNGKKGGLSEEEKLPIPSYVLAGRDIVQTYVLEPVKSNFEGMAIIYDSGMVNLTFKASLGSAKRPEARKADFQVPVHDEILSEGVYLRIGQPFLVAGKLNDMEIGIRRRDTILPWWPTGKDYEKRVVRMWYEITPLSVILYDYSSLTKPSFKYKTLTSTAPAVEKPS